MRHIATCTYFHPRPIPRPLRCPRMVASKKGMDTSAWWNRQSWQFRRRERWCRLAVVPPRRMCLSFSQLSKTICKYIFESIESNRFVICPPWLAVNAVVSSKGPCGVGQLPTVCVCCSTSLPYVRDARTLCLCQLRRLSVTPQQLNRNRLPTFQLTDEWTKADQRRAIEQESPVIARASRYCHFTLFSTCHFLFGYRGMP